MSEFLSFTQELAEQYEAEKIPEEKSANLVHLILIEVGMSAAEDGIDPSIIRDLFLSASEEISELNFTQMVKDRGELRVKHPDHHFMSGLMIKKPPEK